MPKTLMTAQDSSRCRPPALGPADPGGRRRLHLRGSRADEAVPRGADQSLSRVRTPCTGNPQSEWDISAQAIRRSRASPPTSASTRGETVTFKVNTDSNAYTIDIYRLGYYDGAGARKIVTPSVTRLAPPQKQPDVPRRRGHRPGRLRQLGGSRVVGDHRRGLGHLHRQADAHPTPAGRATSSSSCATTRGRPMSSCRPPTRRGRRTTATAAPACTAAARSSNVGTVYERRAPAGRPR